MQGNWMIEHSNRSEEFNAGVKVHVIFTSRELYLLKDNLLIYTSRMGE